MMTRILSVTSPPRSRLDISTNMIGADMKLLMKDLPLEQRMEFYQKAMKMREIGWGAKKIADGLGISQKTVEHWIYQSKVPNRKSNRRIEKNIVQQLCKLYANGESTISLSRAFGMHTATIFRILRRSNIKLRNRSQALKLAYTLGRKRSLPPSPNFTMKGRIPWNKGLTHKMDKRIGNFYDPDLTPSPELSYIVGVYYGDGCVHKSPNGSYSISLSAKDRDFVENFSKCLRKILGRQSKIPIHYDAQGLFRVSVGSCALHDFLKEPIESQRHIIKIYSADFLKGLFDSDGWVTGWVGERHRLRGVVGLGNSDYNLLHFVKTLLWGSFSISATINLYAKAGDNNKGSFCYSKNFYRIRVGGKADIKRYRDSIGFTIRRKQEKLNKLLEAWGLLA